MDAMMPVMEGNETARRRGRRKQEPRCRCQRLIARPVDHDLLLRTFGRLLSLNMTATSRCGRQAPRTGEETR
jgi:hypothetical protein